MHDFTTTTRNGRQWHKKALSKGNNNPNERKKCNETCNGRDESGSIFGPPAPTTFPSLGVLESIYLSAQAPLHMHIYGRLVLELELEPTSHEAQPKQFLKVNFAHNILFTGGLLWGEPQTDT